MTKVREPIDNLLQPDFEIPVRDFRGDEDDYLLPPHLLQPKEVYGNELSEEVKERLDFELDTVWRIWASLATSSSCRTL